MYVRDQLPHAENHKKSEDEPVAAGGLSLEPCVLVESPEGALQVNLRIKRQSFRGADEPGVLAASPPSEAPGQVLLTELGVYLVELFEAVLVQLSVISGLAEQWADVASDDSMQLVGKILQLPDSDV